MDADEREPAPPRSFPVLQEGRYIDALERGLAILACFTPERPVLGIADVVELLGMSHTRVHRYMSTLLDQGYLTQDASRKYRLAAGALDLGMETLNAIGLCRHARPDLQALAKQTGLLVELAVLDSPDVLLVASARVKRGARSKPDLDTLAGSRLPLYCTSLGKVLLANLPAELSARIVSELDLVEQAPNTITSRKRLLAELEDVHEDDFAVNHEEHLASTSALAAPVRDESGDVIAAVNVVAETRVGEVQPPIDRFSGQVIATAHRISRRLGWTDEAS
jgi:IclR family transcriptional regulator, pca regulon regulatory protein